MDRMPCKVIPFPVLVKAVREREEPIMALHTIVLEVDGSRYEVDLMGFVKSLAAKAEGATPMSPLGAVKGRGPAIEVQVVERSYSLRHGWRLVLQLEGSPRRCAAYWRELGIALPSPRRKGEGGTDNSLANQGQQSDQSSCATSATKEDEMSNTESRDTAAQAGTTGGAAATVAEGHSRRASRQKGATKGHKSPTSRAGRQGSKAAGAKGGKTAGKGHRTRPRAQSKGGQILELIGRSKGASMAEMKQATRWQAHSLRGFLSTAAKKHQLQISSTRNEAGERIYKLER